MKIRFNKDARPTVIRSSAIIAVVTKDDRQEVAIVKWKEAKGVGTLNIVPRFGKTRTALKIVARMQRHAMTKTLIVVPNAQVATQWRVEIDNFVHVTKQVIARSYITVVTMASFARVSDEWDLIIYDEIHKLVNTEKGKEAMLAHQSIKFKLGLTGTLPSTAQELGFIQTHVPVIDTITEEEALKNKWINAYEQYNLILPFPKDSYHEYIKFSDYIGETLKLFKGDAKVLNSIEIYQNIYFGFKTDYEVITACLSGRKDITSGRYIQGKEVRDIVGKANGWSIKLNLHTDYDRQIENFWSPDAILKRVLTFNNFIRERKELIDSHSDKLETVLDLVKGDLTKETLIYAGNIVVADILVEMLNRVAGKELAIAFHSKVASKPMIDPSTGDYYRYKSGVKKGLPKIYGKKKLKDFYIESLKNRMHTILVTVESLNEGLNIPNLKRVISLAGSRNSITYRQRSARVKTIDEQDLSKVGEIINLTFDDFTYNAIYHTSVDKVKLIARQSDNTSTPHFTTVEAFKKVKNIQ